MFKFIKVVKEGMKLEKVFNGNYIMLQQLIPKIKNSSDYSEFIEQFGVLAYITKKGIIDRMEELEKSGWAMDTKILVPSIDKNKITIAFAYVNTITKLQLLSKEIGLYDLVQNILDKGEEYYKFEEMFKMFPDEYKRNL